jgi:transcriptional regulator with XRE-family HTH domain
MARRVAANLRDMRKARNLSLDQLAIASGVSRAALSQIETQDVSRNWMHGSGLNG